MNNYQFLVLEREQGQYDEYVRREINFQLWRASNGRIFNLATSRKALTKSKIENRKSRIVRSSVTANSSSSVMTKHSTPSAQR